MAASNAPLPPKDAETKTIIDKLANFVARNGPEFEKMTMTKKREDPKFSFLFGGEHNPYYRWKVDMERVHMGVVSATPTAPQYTATPDPVALVDSLQAVKVKELRDSTIHGLQDPLENEFVNVVKPVMDTCSKEAIASGKSWMFSHAHSAEECGRMAHYTMRRSLDCVGMEFSHKLHLVYLINDLLHHCIRKGANDLKQAMETVIGQIFYNIYSSHPKGVGELGKVVDIWESQEYLTRTKLTQVRRILEYPAANLPPLEPPPPPPAAVINTTTAPPPQPSAPPTQPPPWQQTHPQGFANPAGNPWQQYNWEAPPPPAPPSNVYEAPPPPWVRPPNPVPPAPWMAPPTEATPPDPPPAPWSAPPTEPTPLFAPSESIAPPKDTPPTEAPPTDHVMVTTETIDYNHRPPNIQVFDYQHRPAANWDMFGPPPPPSNAPPPFFHDHPPPFFPHPPPYHHHDNLPPPPAPPPSIPYFDLPAGLMVPLVLLHESGYTPIKPHLVCLPPPQPPSERLCEAVEEFYYPPSDDKPRNEEGWEAKALLDFFNAKTRAKEGNARKGRRNRRSRSRSYSPRRRRRSSSSSVSPPRRRRRSSRSPSSSSDSSDSSHSPARRRGGRRGSSPRSRSFSPSTPTIEDANRRHKMSGPQSESLTEENVGHQLLKRMGWEGAGLGSRGQGICEPIKGGEARDKSNKFAGVGVNMHDPFEQFRKNKSYTFNRRPPPGET